MGPAGRIWESSHHTRQRSFLSSAWESKITLFAIRIPCRWQAASRLSRARDNRKFTLRFPMDHSPVTSTADTSAEPHRPTLERLLDTAATLFWEKGYAATTTREIAAAVGIQQASLYYHIPSKEDLLYQLYVSSLEQLMVDVQSAVDGATDPVERIRVLARAHLATLLRYQKRHVTMLTELRALTERHRAEVVALRDRYGSLVRSVLEDAQASGMIRSD